MNDYGDSTPGVVPWPRPISEEGWTGIAGDFVELISPHTEADPNALLITFLAYAGNAIGRNFFSMAGADTHCGNLYVCLVGHTGSGRKGSAMAAVNAFFTKGPNPPRLGHVIDGISSGEGVIFEIHDAIYKFSTKTNKLEEVEKGIQDKRLLISLSEFQQALAVMKRQDSTLPAILRQAWDKDRLQAPAKNSGVKSTNAHVSVIAGISKEELLSQCEATDAESGMLNRFLFVCCQRSKLLPQGGGFSRLYKSEEWKNLQQRFVDNTSDIEDGPMQIERDKDAEEIWGLNETPSKGLYKELSETRTGLWGAITARGAQQVIRQSVISAAINGSRTISPVHQNAAYEYWRYCDHSAKHIFGDKLDDPTASEIVNALRAVAPAGLSRTQVHRIWGSHKERADIDRALLWLAKTGIVRCEKLAQTSGRPVEMWYAL